MHPDVKRLWALYEETVATDSVKTRVQFGTFLSITLSSHGQAAGWDVDSQAQLAQLWLHRSRQHLEDTSCGYIPMTSVSRFVSLLQEKAVLQDITDKASNLPLFGCTLVQGMCEQKSAVPETSKQGVVSVLQTWLGGAVKTRALATPGDVCDILYGPGVWDLYRPDVDDDNHVAVYLYRSQLVMSPHVQVDVLTKHGALLLPGNVM